MVSFTSPIAQRQVGQTAMTAAFCVSIMTLANMCGRIGFGFIYDILKGWKSLILLMVINGASMLMLTQATTLPYFIVCIVLVGFSFGGLLVVFAPMVRMIFGSKFYNRNYGLIFIGYGIGAFVGPKISAYFYDTTGPVHHGLHRICSISSCSHRTDRDRTEDGRKDGKCAVRNEVTVQ